MKLSYKMPRTMYTASRAAKISHASLLPMDWYAAAVPCRSPWTLAGIFNRSCVFSSASTAWLNEWPGATLNEMVTTGNCPWWLIVKGDGVVVKRLIAERGTGLELEDEELEELDEPPPLPWLLEDDWVEVIAVAGVEVARLMLLLVEEDEVVLPPDEV